MLAVRNEQPWETIVLGRETARDHLVTKRFVLVGYQVFYSSRVRSLHVSCPSETALLRIGGSHLTRELRQIEQAKQFGSEIVYLPINCRKILL